ncbi:MAG TPA: hypothetical protein VGL11_11765 [Candidatus Binatia bacterium]|jgi:hypothetical protein
MRPNFTKIVAGLTLAALIGLGALALSLKSTRTIEVEANKDNTFENGWVAATVRLASGE